MRSQPKSRYHLCWGLLLSVLVAAGCGSSSPRRAFAPPVAGAGRHAGHRVQAGHRLIVGRGTRSRTTGAVQPRRAQTTPHHSPTGPRRPPITWRPIPFGPTRRSQMVAYTRRHYGSFLKPTWRLGHPHVIVIHYTEASFSATYNTFASDTPDSELHELPGTCAHFVIDEDGTIYQLVSLGRMCRHTVGLNWTAIGVEQVGYSDSQVLNDHRQITASLRLVRWLRCRFHIQIKNVIGHNESLSSPYHHEDVPALRTQTHSDFNHADMQVYRARLRALGGCWRGELPR